MNLSRYMRIFTRNFYGLLHIIMCNMFFMLSINLYSLDVDGGSSVLKDSISEDDTRDNDELNGVSEYNPSLEMISGEEGLIKSVDSKTNNLYSLDKDENKQEKNHEEDDKLSNPGPLGPVINFSIDLSANMILSWFIRDGSIDRQLGGFGPSGNGFSIPEIEVGGSIEIDKYVGISSVFVFSLPDIIEIDEIFVYTLDSLISDMEIRLGYMAYNFGHITLISPHDRDFLDLSLAAGRYFGDGGHVDHGLGLDASWLLPFPWHFSFTAGIFHDIDQDDMDDYSKIIDRFVERSEGEYVNDFPLFYDLRYNVRIEQYFDDAQSMQYFVGISSLFSVDKYHDDSFISLNGLDAYIKYYPESFDEDMFFGFKAEVIDRFYKFPSDVIFDFAGYGTFIFNINSYVSCSVRYGYASPSWLLGKGSQLGSAAVPTEGSFSDAPLLEIVPFSMAFLDRFEHRISHSWTFSPTAYTRIRLQGNLAYGGNRDKVDAAIFSSFEFLFSQ